MAAQHDTPELHREMLELSRARLLAECDRALDHWLDGTRKRPLVRSQLNALARSLHVECGAGWSAL